MASSLTVFLVRHVVDAQEDVNWYPVWVNISVLSISFLICFCFMCVSFWDRLQHAHNQSEEQIMDGWMKYIAKLFFLRYC